MNILLIGGSGSLINNLIIKLNKEGHRVYLLTGNKYNKLPYQKVFEQYNFDYDSNCLNEIFESLHLDLTIFMGAHDTNFDWRNEETEAVKYSYSVMNILMGYALEGQGKFIYLSSEEVYSANYEENISETEKVSPAGFKSMVLAQAEELCESYRVNRGLDIVTLRLDHLYGIPTTLKEINNICGRMCMEALDKGSITIHEESKISLLYELDAVEFIYRLIGNKKGHQHSLYNISSSQEITERGLAEMIQTSLGYPIDIVVSGIAPKRKILSNALYESEFGAPFCCETPVIVGKVVEKVKKDQHIFLKGVQEKKSIHERIFDKASWLFKALVPFLENMVAFAIFFFLYGVAVKSEYFANLDIFLLYVLLFAVIYGQQQATFSAVLATAGYYMVHAAERSGFEVMLDTNTYVWIAQIFILGLIVGYLRDRITKLKKENEDERDFLSVQLNDIQDINNSNVRVKDALEAQIINQNDSVGKIYSITSTLDQYSPEEVLFYAAEMLGKLVKSKDVAIYTVSNKQYARLFSATSENARVLGNSIRYTEMGELSETILDRKVYINRKLDDRYPLMANAICDDNDEVQMLVMIWGIPWESMTLGQANQLVIISSLISRAVIRANRYLKALEEQRYVADSKMLEPEAFTELLRAYMVAQDKGLTQSVILKIKTEAPFYMEASQRIMEKLRESDYIGIAKNGGLYVLLPNTKAADAKFVRKRLTALGYESKIVESEKK